jgi:hypothetical protein
METGDRVFDEASFEADRLSRLLMDSLHRPGGHDLDVVLTRVGSAWGVKDVARQFDTVRRIYRTCVSLDLPFMFLMLGDGSAAMINTTPLIIRSVVNAPFPKRLVNTAWLDPTRESLRFWNPLEWLGISSTSTRHRYATRRLEAVARANERRGFRLQAVDAALALLHDSVSRFLEIRLRRGVDEREGFGPGSAVQSVDGRLPISVETRSGGVHVDASPAYFIDWEFFGGPTRRPPYAPPDFLTAGALSPGRYIFRGRTPAWPSGIEERGTVFSIPPAVRCPVISF